MPENSTEAESYQDHGWQTDDRVAFIKARVLGDDIVSSNVRSHEESDTRKFNQAGAIEPPYPADVLCTLFEHSNSLRQNVDAYATNIDGFGHRFEPRIDLESSDADDRLRALIESERREREEDAREITADDIEARKEELRKEMMKERAIAASFFEFSHPKRSFVSLRRELRTDREITGNGYWEVLRDGEGKPAQLMPLASFNTRLMPLDDEAVEIETPIRTDDLVWDTVTVHVRFRRYVQIIHDDVVYFKEFGDPRVISKLTGKVFESVEALKSSNVKDGPATEVLHFDVPSIRSAYGIPRWIGALLAVLGSRQAEEVNLMYFENKSIPPMVILVSGGRLAASADTKISDFIQNEIKGKRNFHKILVLEAAPAKAGGPDGPDLSGRVKVEIKPLTQFLQSDALFQKYDERNMDKVGSSFRMPRLLRGDARDFNRATAIASLEFAENQVFAPEREEFDFLINRLLMPALGVRWWLFVSNGPPRKDPDAVSDRVLAAVKTGVLVPEEGRQLLQGVFNREFETIDDFWAKQPIALTLAGFEPVEELAEDEAEEADIAARLEAVRAEMNKRAKKGDLTTEDLRELGSAVVLTQGIPRRRQRLRPQATGMFGEAQRLLRFRDTLKAVEVIEADRAFREEASVDEPELIEMTPEELAELGVIPHDSGTGAED
jgi:PBSX family phage portal protein